MKKTLLIIAIVIAALFAITLILGPIATYFVNKEIDKHEEYEGHVKDIDINLFRGAYNVDSVYIDFIASEEEKPLFTATEIDFSLEWQALFDGAIVGEVKFTEPQLFLKMVEDSLQTPEPQPLDEVLRNMMPITVNRLEVEDGRMHYIDKSSSPEVNIQVENLQLTGTNLTNVTNGGDSLPASITTSATLPGNGKFSADVALNVMENPMQYDAKAELEDINLTGLNAFTEAYAGFTFEAGQMYLGLEAATEGSRYGGFVKPVLEDVRVIDLDSENQGFWRKAWEVGIGATVEGFENQPKDRFASKVPFSGDRADTEVGVWTSIGNVLENAFIDAFEKNLAEDSDVGKAKEQKEQEEEDDGFLGIF